MVAFYFFDSSFGGTSLSVAVVRMAFRRVAVRAFEGLAQTDVADSVKHIGLAVLQIRPDGLEMQPANEIVADMLAAVARTLRRDQL